VLGSRADDRAAHVQPQHLCVPLEHPFDDLQADGSIRIEFIATPDLVADLNRLDRLRTEFGLHSKHVCYAYRSM